MKFSNACKVVQSIAEPLPVRILNRKTAFVSLSLFCTREDFRNEFLLFDLNKNMSKHDFCLLINFRLGAKNLNNGKTIK